jgi:hypothetical protein
MQQLLGALSTDTFMQHIHGKHEEEFVRPCVMLRFMQEVLDTVQAAGAGQISFNPLTVPNVAKALINIANAEKVPLSVEAANAIATAAAGDLRNAVNNLQLMFGVGSLGLGTQIGKVGQRR